MRRHEPHASVSYAAFLGELSTGKVAPESMYEDFKKTRNKLNKSKQKTEPQTA